jgi:hypothetical protein
MPVVWYGPFARLADLYHGWRDGSTGIPDPDCGVATMPHREVLIRRAQDAFDHERVRAEAHGAAATSHLIRALGRHDQAEAGWPRRSPGWRRSRLGRRRSSWLAGGMPRTGCTR